MAARRACSFRGKNYQARNLVPEHESVNDLIAVHRNASSKSNIDALLTALHSLESVNRQEGARLLMRVYNLATLAKTPTLVGRAEADLEHYPIVERSLFRYLATLGWPEASRALLLRALGRPSHDTLALSALSALLNDSAAPQIAPDVKRALLDASFGSSPCHPLARVAAHACLARISAAGERPRLAHDFLDWSPRTRVRFRAASRAGARVARSLCATTKWLRWCATTIASSCAISGPVSRRVPTETSDLGWRGSPSAAGGHGGEGWRSS